MPIKECIVCGHETFVDEKSPYPGMCDICQLFAADIIAEQKTEQKPETFPARFLRLAGESAK